MATTLEEIAKAAGFSIATVSRVITNSKYPVSADTRERIMEVAQAMGYRPNIAARSLRTDQTNMIGIVVDDILAPFVPPVIRGIQDFLKKFDYLNLIVNTDWDPEVEKEAIDTLVSRPVDGIIFVEYSHLEVNELLERSNKPYVFVHRLFGPPVKNSVVPDDNYGARLAVRHLASLGHRRIAHITGPEGWYAAFRRLAGYKEELAANNLTFDPALVQPGDWEYDGGAAATRNLLALEHPPSAIFAANDVMALGAISAIQEAGLNVPKDMAIVGYDNREFTKIFRPRVTSVSLPIYDMGRAAAELLFKQIEEGREDTDEIRVQGQLYIRETCGADESLRTQESMNETVNSKRIPLRKDPDGSSWSPIV